jgi:hypothetical protein
MKLNEIEYITRLKVLSRNYYNNGLGRKLRQARKQARHGSFSTGHYSIGKIADWRHTVPSETMHDG